MLLWLAKTVILTFICGFLAWLGVRALDAVTPDIPARQRIGESPLATGLFISGFFILVGLVVHGVAMALLGLSLVRNMTSYQGSTR